MMNKTCFFEFYLCRRPMPATYAGDRKLFLDLELKNLSREAQKLSETTLYKQILTRFVYRKVLRKVSAVCILS